MKKLLAAAAVLVVVASAVLVVSPRLRSVAMGEEVPAASAGASPVSRAGEAEAPAPAPRSSATIPVPNSAPSPSAAPSLNELVEDSKTFDEAIAKARASFGPNDPRVFELLGMAETICSQNPDPTGATNPKHPDPARGWAVARLLDLCEGYKPDNSASRFSDGPQDLAQISREKGKEAAVSEANRRLRSANDFDTLYSSGQILLENGALPLDQILPGHRERYGVADLVPAWAMASQLVGCTGGSHCGPDSLPTAVYCAHSGCVHGVTYEQALTQGLPPAQLRAVMAFRQWILTQRQVQP